MDRKTILKVIKELGNSQGTYSRLYISLTNGTQLAEDSLRLLEMQDFKTPAELVTFIEV